MESFEQQRSALQRRLGYRFRDPGLLAQALTHTSYLQDHPEAAPANQRLEFLGDSVLGLVLSAELFRLFPEAREGPLSKRRAALTEGDFLCELACELEIDRALRLGQSEEQTGGRQRPSILEDALEAVVGAIYLDSDFATVRGIVLRWFGPLGRRLAGRLADDNPKGRLQELVQSFRGRRTLRYELVGTAGAPHEREYEVSVSLGGRPLGTGRGPSKQRAGESAARIALDALERDPSLGRPE